MIESLAIILAFAALAAFYWRDKQKGNLSR
jgi:hypothetical protein